MGDDSTHRMSAYNHHHQPSSRDQRQIDRIERETMVLYPTLQPNLVLNMMKPWIFWWQRSFPQRYWRHQRPKLESRRAQSPTLPRNGLACLQPECEEGPSTSAAFYRQQREAAPFVTRRKYNRKSPSRRPHRRVPYYPPSPQYKSCSTLEDEAEQISAARGKYTDPTPTPYPQGWTCKHGARRNWQGRRQPRLFHSPRGSGDDHTTEAYSPVQPAGQSPTGGSGSIRPPPA